MHVSETGLERGEKPQDHFKEGDSVRTRILRIDDAEMKVGLSALNLEDAASPPAAAAPESPPPGEAELPPSAPAEASGAAEAKSDSTAKKRRTRKKPKDTATEG